MHEANAQMLLSTLWAGEMALGLDERQVACPYCNETFTMPDQFDAYHKWLGIAAKEQPPDHYRLLGIPLFESDPEVIEHAADQRTAHLRSISGGPHFDLSQRLLNEVSRAKVCLMQPVQRQAYDAQLKANVAVHKVTERAAAPPAVQPPPAPQPSPVPTQASVIRASPGQMVEVLEDTCTPPEAAVNDQFPPITCRSVPSAGSRYRRARRHRRKPFSPAATVAQIVLAGILGILLGLLVLWVMGFGNDHLFLGPGSK